jgi:hypothetical protein
MRKMPGLRPPRVAYRGVILSGLLSCATVISKSTSDDKFHRKTMSDFPDGFVAMVGFTGWGKTDRLGPA